MVKLKNTGEQVHVWAPSGAAAAQLVEHDQVIEVPGELADPEAAGALPGDAHVVVLPGGEQRAFPTSRWQLVTAPSARRDSGGRE